MAEYEPTEAEVQAAALAAFEHDFDRMHCLDHGGLCCPCGNAHDLTHREADEHAATEVARSVLAVAGPRLKESP